jgi:exonuclease SbcC
MFIDEGFGTLDNEMLENTKKMLLELGKRTNRRIGIISHIQELERSIPSQIRVKKTDKGSSFEIINN